MLPSPALPLTRREAIRRILAASALAATFESRVWAAETEPPVPGIGFDPNLLQKEIPWPRLLTAEEKRTVTALADLIIPADEFGPAASAVGVTDFIDEWVSAPYEQQVRERKTIREGLAWLDAEARKRTGGKLFADGTLAEQTALLSEVVREGTEARKEARPFFLVFRDRVAGGYYTTPEGWKALGYTGNSPTPEFAGPPPEALAHAGLA